MTENPACFDFGRIANEYDNWYETPEGGLYDWLEKRVLLRLFKNIERGGNLLEVGSGTGWWSQFFSGLGFKVTGIDISAHMCNLARLKKIPDAVFKQADAHQPGFADHSFAVTAAITTIEFTRNPEQVVREMVRCTRAGGHLILGVLNGSAMLNRDRKKMIDSPFLSARFFSLEELKALLAPYGQPMIIPCAFHFSLKLPRFLAGRADDLQAVIGKTSNAFMAAGVRL